MARDVVASFADRLDREYQAYRDADETGRFEITAWRDPWYETRFGFEPVDEADLIGVRLALG